MQSVCAQRMIEVANGFISAVSEISFEAVHAEINKHYGQIKIVHFGPSIYSAVASQIGSATYNFFQIIWNTQATILYRVQGIL